MKTLVMKFGGTSIGNPDAIRRSAQLVAGQKGIYDGIVVVVSALNGVTNLLIDSAREAAQASLAQIEIGIQSYYDRHARLIEALQFDYQEEKDLILKLEQRTSQFRTILANVHRIGHLEPAMQDAAASLGERMSAPILAALLRQVNILAHEVDASQLIVTDENYTRASVQFNITEEHIITQILPILEKGIIPIVTGFIGATRSGNVTTLGRGASDYSSTILGAALNAREIWNWTDVDGVMNADPRLEPQASVIPALSYETMNILAKYGEKVLHPETLRPVSSLGIPLRVRNSFHPDSPGTLIRSKQPVQHVSPLAVVSKSDLILVEKENTSNDIVECLPGYNLDSLDPHFQVCYAIPAEKVGDLGGLSNSEHARETPNTSLISIIGGTLPAQMAVFFLNAALITVLAVRVNSLDRCTSVSVREKDTARAVQVLYDSLIEKAPGNPGVNSLINAWSTI